MVEGFAKGFGPEEQHRRQRRALVSEDLLVALRRRGGAEPVPRFHPALHLGEGRALDDGIGRHRCEHFPEDQGRFAVAAEPLVGHREAEPQGRVEMLDLREIFQLPLDASEDGAELEDGALGVRPGLEQGDALPDLPDFLVLIVEKALGRPDPLQAGDGVVVTLILEEGRAQLQGEGLKGDDLGHLPEVRVLAADHGEGLVVLAGDEAAVQLEDDGPARGLGRGLAHLGSLRFEEVRRLHGELLHQVEVREKEEGLVALEGIVGFIGPVFPKARCASTSPPVVIRQMPARSGVRRRPPCRFPDRGATRRSNGAPRDISSGPPCRSPRAGDAHAPPPSLPGRVRSR